MKKLDLDNREFIFLDGGFGTMLQSKGIDLGKIPEVLNITNPEAVKAVHNEYIEAGSDIIYTCSFGVNKYKLKGSEYTVNQLITAAVKNAKDAAEGKDVKVALDLGPIGKMLHPNGDLSFEEAYEMFKLQVVAGANAGADLIVIETMTDLYEAKAALLAAKENSTLPVIVTMTFESSGRTFTGTTVSSMALTLEGLGADAIGINCSLGPKEFKPLIEELSKWTTLPIVAKANAGLPDPETGAYNITAEEYAGFASDLIQYGVKFVGGCCGTNPEFICQIRKAFEDKKYIPQNPHIPSAVCSPERTVIIDRPRIIGERLNPTGKKVLKEALSKGNMDYVLEQAANQIEEGAEILDVNVGVPGIDEVTVMKEVIKSVQGVAPVPLQIDSNSEKVVEAALRIYSGKAIVNSVSGEEKSLKSILPIVKKYGAAVVGLTLDEEGIPKSVEKRVEIAEKIMNRALAIGIRKEDIYIDCLTLTVSAEQKNAANTLKAMAEIKKRFGLKTVLGVSNISFGLPQRPMINHNFLQMALTCGLDLPIMNPAAAEMVEAVYVHNLIMNIDKDAQRFIEKYKDVEINRNISSKKGEEKNRKEESPESKIAYAINNGLGEQLKTLIEEQLKVMEPLQLINSILIPILDEAGDRFEKGKIFIPELILCASTSQIAFEMIKKRILSSGNTESSGGKIVIATVKGDVHDIGKNIVRVILENYGYDIIDLGKDVEPELVLETVKRQNVKLVGLSALMTTTLPNMEETIKLLKQNVPECVIMVGGAVLTAEYAEKIGADFYVKDAKESADVAKKVL